MSHKPAYSYAELSPKGHVNFSLCDVRDYTKHGEIIAVGMFNKLQKNFSEQERALKKLLQRFQNLPN